MSDTHRTHCRQRPFSTTGCLSWIAILFASWPSVSLAQNTDKSSLTIIIPGINDEASAHWVGASSALGGATRQRYAIVYDEGEAPAPRDPDFEVDISGSSTKRGQQFGQYLKRDYSGFDDDHVIRVNPNDPVSMRRFEQRLDEIAKQPNATVVVDTNIGVELNTIGPQLRDAWTLQNDWAGKVAAKLAARYLDAKHRDSTRQIAPATVHGQLRG